MFADMFSLSNAKKAAPVAAAVGVALWATSSQHWAIKGGASVLAAMVALPLAAKL